MINVDYQGRLGNNLFQYGVGVLFSRKCQQAISNPIDNRIFKPLDELQDQITLDESRDVTDTNYWSCYHDTIDTNINIVGYFQSRDVINTFHKEKTRLFNDFGTQLNTFVHVRLGDIQSSGLSYSIEYYRNALKDSVGGYISSDTPRDDMIKRLSDEFSLQLYENDPEDTIIFGSQFDNKVLSLGSFSWWIGFLGNQNNVICPDPTIHGSWLGDIYPFQNWKIVT